MWPAHPRTGAQVVSQTADLRRRTLLVVAHKSKHGGIRRCCSRSLSCSLIFGLDPLSSTRQDESLQSARSTFLACGSRRSKQRAVQ